jgi:hypothetical protein
MSAPSESDADPAGSANSNGGTPHAADTGVLAQLPRTRPQRSSPRRDAARRAARSGTRATTAAKSPSKPSKAAAAKPVPRAGKPPAKAKRARAGTPGVRATTPSHATPKRIRVAAEPAATPVPRQGFESESDRARGPVRPPGGTELLTSAVEIVGELTKAGLSTGERLVRDVFSLLPRS